MLTDFELKTCVMPKSEPVFPLWCGRRRREQDAERYDQIVEFRLLASVLDSVANPHHSHTFATFLVEIRQGLKFPPKHP